MFLLCDDSGLRLAYKQLSFSRYAYDGEDQCLSPLPHNGDLSEEAQRENRSGNRIASTQSVDGAEKVLKNSAEDKQEDLFDAKCRHDSSK